MKKTMNAIVDFDWRTNTPIPASERCRRQPSWGLDYCRTLYHTRYSCNVLAMSVHSSYLECSLYFNHTLFRGNRVSKVSSYDLNAFNSPNFPPLVNGLSRISWLYTSHSSRPPIVGIDVVVNWNEVLRQTNLRRFRSHKSCSIVYHHEPH